MNLNNTSNTENMTTDNKNDIQNLREMTASNSKMFNPLFERVINANTIMQRLKNDNSE